MGADLDPHSRVGPLVPIALKALPPALLAQPNLLETPAWSHTTTPLSWCYEFARFASYRYGLPLPRFEIAFRPLEGHAGDVADRGRTFVITIDEEFSDDRGILGHIVAHELSHLVINRARVNQELPATNELLTDLVAVLAGFGPVMVAGKERSTSWQTGDGERVRTVRVGYLSESELHWLMRVRHHITDQEPWLRPSLDRRRADKTPCVVCHTLLRLPDLRATIALRCPMCRVRQLVRLRHGSVVQDALFRLWRWLKLRNVAA